MHSALAILGRKARGRLRGWHYAFNNDAQSQEHPVHTSLRPGQAFREARTGQALPVQASPEALSTTRRDD